MLALSPGIKISISSKSAINRRFDDYFGIPTFVSYFSIYQYERWNQPAGPNIFCLEPPLSVPQHTTASGHNER